MATITDQLITVLKLVGANEYAHGLHTAEKAVEKLAGSHKKAKAAGVGKEGEAAGGGGLADLLSPKKLTGGALAFLGVQGLRQFSEAEGVIFRTTVALKNLGSSLQINDVQQFASGMQQLTGINDEAIVSTVGLLKRFGAQDDQIKSLTATIADFSRGSGISMEHAGTAVGHALIGNTRMLRNMGIEFKSTGDRAKDFVKIQETLNNIYGGSAKAFRNTLPGSIEALSNAFGDLFEAIGSKLATVVVPIVNALTDVVNFFANNIILFTTAVGALAGFVLGGPMGALIGAVAGLGVGLLPNKGNAAEGIGNGKSKLATEDTLNKIEKNTSKLNESLISQVLGGAGTVANAAGNWRDMALGFRA